VDKSLLHEPFTTNFTNWADQSFERKIGELKKLMESAISCMHAMISTKKFWLHKELNG